MKKYISLLLVLALCVVTMSAFAAAAPNYNLDISASIDENGELLVSIYNGNNFIVNDLNVEIAYKGETKTVTVNSIDKLSTWTLDDETTDYADFNFFGYYNGEESVTDVSQYDPATGTYNAFQVRYSVYWPDEDTDEEWAKSLTTEFEDIGATVKVDFIARGPRVAFTGHSFTGFWDTTYYYLRELAQEAGYNAQVAFNYWGGMGISHHAGVVEGTDAQLEANLKLFAANDYYDYYIVAGNGDEALTTSDGLIGSTKYTQRDDMEKGASILWNLANEKRAQVILWCIQPYEYGFFVNNSKKPWYEGKVGDVYTDDKGSYRLTMTRGDMAREDAKYYEYLASITGDGSSLVAQIGTVYDYMCTYYMDIVNPYKTLTRGDGDNSHQNNQGNYIAACILYGLLFNESPEGLSIPESHTWGTEGGAITEEQAELIQKVSWMVVSGEYSLIDK